MYMPALIPAPPERTTRYGRRVYFPSYYNLLEISSWYEECRSRNF